MLYTLVRVYGKLVVLPWCTRKCKKLIEMKRTARILNYLGFKPLVNASCDSLKTLWFPGLPPVNILIIFTPGPGCLLPLTLLLRCMAPPVKHLMGNNFIWIWDTKGLILHADFVIIWPKIFHLNIWKRIIYSSYKFFLSSGNGIFMHHCIQQGLSKTLVCELFRHISYFPVYGSKLY